MIDHSEQTSRIRTKLVTARKADKQLKVFGAEKHKYSIGPTVSDRDIQSLQDRFAISLPDCYRAFLVDVGNGGSSHRQSAAGPFYGIYPLGTGLNKLVENPTDCLKKSAILNPFIADDEWSNLTHKINDEHHISDEDYELELENLYGGLLPIGTQGCTYIHAIVLNGPFKGKVVNLDLDHQKPRFAFESNFLDWYERWLDEVIAGYLSQGGPTWFGYTMGGDDESLMRQYSEAASHHEKIEILKGLTKLSTASKNSCRSLLKLCDEPNAEIRHLALKMLTKLAYSKAREPLKAHLRGDDLDCLAAYQSIYWYARARSRKWIDVVKDRLPTVNEPETFRFACYLLRESKVDHALVLMPFCEHESEELRVTAFFSLGSLKNKGSLVSIFAIGLQDNSPRVVHATLQSLAGVRDESLLPHYAQLVHRFKTDEHHVLTNLKQRLKEIGIESIESLRKQNPR